MEAKIVKDRIDFKIFEEQQIGDYRRNAVDYYGWSEPDQYPCLVICHIEESQYEYPTIYHYFLYTNDLLIEKMSNYKQKQKEIKNITKDQLSIYLVDPDEIIRNMAEQKYKELMK